MKTQAKRYRAIPVFILLALILTGCTEALPTDAKEIVFEGFDSEEGVTIVSAIQVEPLQKDLDIGAEEVWCVAVSFECWSCDRGEFQTCADNRLVRRVNGEWQVSVVFTEEDMEMWEARGCELIEGKVSG